jgi:hypothetical protein
LRQHHHHRVHARAGPPGPELVGHAAPCTAMAVIVTFIDLPMHVLLSFFLT